MKNYTNRMILHMDGDAFFASVEQAKDWRLRGKPVITGGERFIAASMSYEAKARGITRGMNVKDIKKTCPEAIILSSDYVTYGIFARRMYNIVRTYAPIVEEYSIDECFADITGLDALMGISYEDIGKKIKADLERKLGITFGVGLAATKVLAKAASKHRKPAGFTYIPPDGVSNYHVTSQFDTPSSNDRISFLKNTFIEKVWGIGTSTTKLLRANGILSALDFANLNSQQLSALSIAKPYREIHAELNGLSVMPVNSEKRPMPKSVMCSRTFTPPSRDSEIIFSHLSKNIEEACERLRHDGVEATACSFYLKSQEFRYYGAEHIFEYPTNDPVEVLAAARMNLKKMYKNHLEYRTTGISLRGLVPMGLVTHKGLFDAYDTKHSLYENLDKINRKYGEHSIMLGSSMRAVGFYNKKRKQKRVWEIPFLGFVR
jgi:DNA polymerase-4